MEKVELLRETIHPSPFRLSVKSLESFRLGVLKFDSSKESTSPKWLKSWIDVRPTRELWPLLERILNVMFVTMFFFLLILINF